MSNINKECIGWVTATCKNKKCKKAFMIYDKKGEFNNEPTNKFYCPECVKNGFKNKRAINTKDNKKNNNSPSMFLNKNKIKDKIVRREFLKICRNRGKYLRYNDILKEAMEVASYYNEN